MKTSEYNKDRVEMLLKSTFPDANWQVACPIFCDCNDVNDTKVFINANCECRKTNKQCEVCEDQHIFVSFKENLTLEVYIEFKWNEDLQKNEELMFLEVALEWDDEYEMREYLSKIVDWNYNDMIDLIMTALNEEQERLEKKVNSIINFRNTYKR